MDEHDKPVDTRLCEPLGQFPGDLTARGHADLEPAQTVGPLVWTRLLPIGVPLVWLTGAALCVLLTVLVPFAGRAINLAAAAQP